MRSRRRVEKSLRPQVDSTPAAGAGAGTGGAPLGLVLSDPPPPHPATSGTAATKAHKLRRRYRAKVGSFWFIGREPTGGRARQG